MSEEAHKRLMRVARFIPSKQYGFLRPLDGEGSEVFFHLNRFNPGHVETVGRFMCRTCTGCDWLRHRYLPVVGERVLVVVDEEDESPGAKKALSVDRTDSPFRLRGTVESFDRAQGYGWIIGQDGVRYHLHASEFFDPSMVVEEGTPIRFVSGTRENRPRALYVWSCHE